VISEEKPAARVAAVQSFVQEGYSTWLRNRKLCPGQIVFAGQRRFDFMPGFQSNDIPDESPCFQSAERTSA